METQKTWKISKLVWIGAGIFILGFTMAAHFPIIVEMAILLDVLAAVSVMVLSLDKINQTFTHTDVDKLDSLKG